MRTADGNFRCDICQSEIGCFDVDTGNHPVCTELVALRARVAELETALEKYASRANWLKSPGAEISVLWVGGSDESGWEIAERALKGGRDE